jgi:hypothetical protein
MTYSPAWVAVRAELHDLLARYAWAIDTWDAEAATACFASDGTLQRGDGEVVATGHAELLAFFSRGRSGGRFGTMADGELLAVSHSLGSVLCERIDDSTASGRSGCTATSLARHPDGEHVHLHGIRYEDVFTAETDGWRIARRTHYVDWVRTVDGRDIDL